MPRHGKILRACLQGERVSPCARVTLASGIKLALGYKQISGNVTLSPGSTLPALLTCFVIRDILCNGPRIEII